jgi:hypothetical protein
LIILDDNLYLNNDAAMNRLAVVGGVMGTMAALALWAHAAEPLVVPKFDAQQVGPRTVTVDAAEYRRTLHVAPAGSDASGDGSRAKPWATVAHALKQAAAGKDARVAVLIAAGEYPTVDVAMQPHVDLFGGFDPKGWERDIVRHETILDPQKKGRVLRGADDARVDGFTIRNGRVAGHGGAIFCDHVSPTITNNRIVDNATVEPEGYVHELQHQVGNDGGAIACVTDASPTIANNLIAGNTTGVGNGGGISLRNYGTAQIVNNVIVDNVTGLTDAKQSRSSNGGGIGCVNARPRIAGNVISGNRVGGNGDAGGVYCEYDAHADIFANMIVGNEAEDDGGGIYVMKCADPRIIANVVAGNVGGGAIRISKEGRGRIFNNVIFGNDTGDINTVHSWMIFCNNTLADNKGAAVAYENRAAHLQPSIITNNIFHGNTPPKGYGQVHLAADNGMQLPVVSHCLVQGGFSGPGNIDGDPGFVDDGHRGEVSGATYDPATRRTTLKLSKPLPNDFSAAGRVIKVNERWCVIHSAVGEKVVVWAQIPKMTGTAKYEICKTYRLRAGSPCIDAGAKLGAAIMPVEQDIDGQPRVAGATIDIGADEVISTTAAADEQRGQRPNGR